MTSLPPTRCETRCVQCGAGCAGWGVRGTVNVECGGMRRAVPDVRGTINDVRGGMKGGVCGGYEACGVGSGVCRVRQMLCAVVLNVINALPCNCVSHSIHSTPKTTDSTSDGRALQTTRMPPGVREAIYVRNS